VNVASGNGRLPMLAVEASREEARKAGVAELMAPLSVFRTLLQHPELTSAVSGLLTMLLRDGVLEPRLRELLIMRIGWVTGSVYEWTQHWAVARAIGMSDEEILGVREWRAHEGYGPAERAVLEAVDDTLETGAIRPETWRKCETHLGGTRELLELVVAIGNWQLFSSLLRSLEIPLEDGVAPWPPDGEVPPAAR
jgi:alkylhydroperoxidase family enzyme